MIKHAGFWEEGFFNHKPEASGLQTYWYHMY